MTGSAEISWPGCCAHAAGEREASKAAAIAAIVHRISAPVRATRSGRTLMWIKLGVDDGGVPGPKQKWGPASLPAPTCTELRICRCSLAWRLSPPALRSWLTSSGVASDSGPARRLVQPSSAALLGLVPFASLAPRGSRELRLEDQLFRRLFRWSDLGRSPPHRHPVEIGPSATCRSFLPLPALRRGGDFRPDHPCNLTHFCESRKRKKRVFACG